MAVEEGVGHCSSRERSNSLLEHTVSLWGEGVRPELDTTSKEQMGAAPLSPWGAAYCGRQWVEEEVGRSLGATGDTGALEAGVEAARQPLSQLEEHPRIQAHLEMLGG